MKVISVNCGVKNYMKIADYRSYHRSYRRSYRRNVRIPYKPKSFFRLSFRNCKSCVYNCDDLLSDQKNPANKKFELKKL